MKQIFILIIFVLAILILSCNSEISKPYVVNSITDIDQFEFGFINYQDEKGNEYYIYDEVKFYKIGEKINEN